MQVPKRLQRGGCPSRLCRRFSTGTDTECSQLSHCRLGHFQHPGQLGDPEFYCPSAAQHLHPQLWCSSWCHDNPGLPGGPPLRRLRLGYSLLLTALFKWTADYRSATALTLALRRSFWTHPSSPTTQGPQAVQSRQCFFSAHTPHMSVEELDVVGRCLHA